ncbi:APC family permease [Saccharopolyspora sp. HNM0983]|uniref:APC family permease n=1 Tax=Saccharopolyspora montiporae TaxID=2781240 RepID=A0A929FYY0_9PSEU|nr:APC family permease [Saccharopolyspora sp. HNM0983]MBE9373177.1 APC family permease [Saccharopolyspora sp. HNM0983]
MAQQVESPTRRASSAGAAVLALGGMLGAGVLLGPAAAAAAAGPWAPLGLLLALIAAGCSAFSSAQHSKSYRGPGASYACVRGSLGVLPGRIAAGAHLAAQIAGIAAVAGTAGRFFFPDGAGRIGAGAILLVVLAATAGLRIAGAAAWLWLALTAAVFGLIVVVCFAIEPAPAIAHASAAPDSAVGITGAAGVLLFAFLGFERLTAPDAEQRRYGWTQVRRGTAAALLVTAGVVALLTAALVHQLGWQRLGLTTSPVQDVLVASAAAELTPLVSVGVAVALLPVLLAALESARSTSAALVADGELPRALGRTGGGGTAYLLDLGTGLAAVVVVLLVEPLPALAFAACAVLIHFILANAATRSLFDGDRTWSPKLACLGTGLSVVLVVSMPVPAMLGALAVVALAAAGLTGIATFGARTAAESR